MNNKEIAQEWFECIEDQTVKAMVHTLLEAKDTIIREIEET